jgi:hypothetical protein
MIRERQKENPIEILGVRSLFVSFRQENVVIFVPPCGTRGTRKNKNSFRAKEKLSPSVWLFVPYIKTHVKGHHPRNISTRIAVVD